MDVFMRNKAIYIQHVQNQNYSSELSKNFTINYLIYVRKNIDTAVATKTLIANTLAGNYRRQRAVQQKELLQLCQAYAKDFKRICGSTVEHFDLFLRHFPLMFRVRANTVSLRNLDMDELQRKYKALIRTPSLFLEDGLLPPKYVPSFKTTLIEDKDLGDQIINNILINNSRVAIDLEGYNLGLYGIITLCQVSVSPDHVYLFDILKCPYHLQQGALKNMFESKKIQKVFHGIAGDAANLYQQFNITLRNVYDTQAAFQCLQTKYKDLRMDYNELEDSWKISLNELMALYKFDTNQMKGAVKSLYRGNPNLWSYRPLCQALMHYAGEDVNLLLKLQDAIERHPHFKPDLNDTIAQSENAISQQIKAAGNLTWVPPNCPEPKSVLKLNRNKTKQYFNKKPYVFKSRVQRDLMNAVSTSNNMESEINHLSKDSSCILTPSPSCHHRSFPGMTYSHLFMVTIGLLFLMLFNVLKLWRKNKSMEKKRKYFHQILIRESFDRQKCTNKR